MAKFLITVAITALVTLPLHLLIFWLGARWGVREFMRLLMRVDQDECLRLLTEAAKRAKRRG